MPLRLRGNVLAWPVLAASAAWVGCAVTGCEQQSSEALARVDAPIVGGKLDTSHRGVVSLLKALADGFYPACSGTLLTPNLVLTAHHCVASLDSADGASVQCGKTEFGATDAAASLLISVEANVGTDGLKPYPVARVWVPDGDNSVCGRDIALLRLSGAGVPANQATPIAPGLDQDLLPDEVFAAIGYGLQDPKDASGSTVGHRMSIANAKVFCEGTACGTALLQAGEFMADSPVCSGDSGGPALDLAGHVRGVASRGDDKCTVGIYSSVAAWRDFIVEKTFVASVSGHYYAPPAWAGKPPANFEDPLGTSCTGTCPEFYACWAPTNKPPGSCVPKCSAQESLCPAEYTCDTKLGACIKPSALPKGQPEQDGGCSVTAAAAGREPRDSRWLGLGLGLGLLGALWRGRRARRTDRPSGT